MALDHEYLVWAYHRGGAINVPCPAARASLVSTGLMEPARVRDRYSRHIEPFGMALTKKGQRRAEQIAQQNQFQARWARKRGRYALHVALSKRKGWGYW